MKIATVIGARPQFIKAAMVSRAIEKESRLKEYIIHTGQHYDQNMNDVFFQTLNLKKPDWQLHCGGRTNPSKMLAEMMTGIEEALVSFRPDHVLVYGDTLSTLAGSLAASQLHIPVCHVEAGLRSYNKQMPEEINRLLTDHLSSMLFCPTRQAVINLSNEGITENVFYSGDVMYDAVLTFGLMAEEQSNILSTLGLQTKKFRLCTVHRAENTDDSERLQQIIFALIEIATPECPVIFPVHPRTRIAINRYHLHKAMMSNDYLRLIEPVSYMDMVMLEKNAITILTDSGGIQKEAYFYRTPCVTLRNETEWTETVDAGWNQIAGYQTQNILTCVGKTPAKSDIDEYGDGHAADNIVSAMIKREGAKS